MTYLRVVILSEDVDHERKSSELSQVRRTISDMVFLPSMVFLCAPAIGGFVAVSQMLKAYGIFVTSLFDGLANVSISCVVLSHVAWDL